MALTVSRVSKSVDSIGNLKAVIADITFDSSYAAGGESFVAADVGLAQILHVTGSTARNASTGAATVRYDHTNSTLQAFAGATEVADTTNLSAYSARVIVFGR